MRKIIFAVLAASVMVPAAASAQSRDEVRRGQAEVQRDRQDAREATRQGDYKKAARARQEAREDQREVREDWRDYRAKNRSTFQRGQYQAPRGQRYRPVSVGYRFQPAFYGRNYWVNNYSNYRLPNPGYGHRWIRHGNDVVLIDARSGRVLRVLNNFFW